jgi:hypothetical protein
MTRAYVQNELTSPVDAGLRCWDAETNCPEKARCAVADIFTPSLRTHLYRISLHMWWHDLKIEDKNGAGFHRQLEFDLSLGPTTSIACSAVDIYFQYTFTGGVYADMFELKVRHCFDRFQSLATLHVTSVFCNAFRIAPYGPESRWCHHILGYE